jgi:hypothetical protein
MSVVARAGSEVKFPCPANFAAAFASSYGPRALDRIDWTAKLFDSEGMEHRLVELGPFCVVTRVGVAYAIWDRQLLVQAGDPEGLKITNAPLTDVQKTQRYLRECTAMYP